MISRLKRTFKRLQYMAMCSANLYRRCFTNFSQKPNKTLMRLVCYAYVSASF